MSTNRNETVARARAAEVSVNREALERAFLHKLFSIQGKFAELATPNDYYMALAFTVRDLMLRRWVNTAATYTRQRVRTVCYLSAEYLLGPQLGSNLVSLGIYEDVRAMINGLGLDFDGLLAQEPEPGLGNGGLGRLAACFIDSLATLEIPTLAYGIRYEFGIFQQEIVDGWQVEKTDKWLKFGNPWELPRPEWAVPVQFGGYTERYQDEHGRLRVRWVPSRLVNGVPYDTPVLGYHNNTANTLRLWRAEAPESFDFSVFNRGDYYGAVNQKVTSENLTKVLYPNDEQTRGKELRLEQQYFFVSCSLQDMFRVMEVQRLPTDKFHEKFAVQLNDTHPAIAVAELMRLLVDVHVVPWETAWDITRRTMGYTNHTLMPEALECWPLDLFQRILPRHLEIIFEINARFLDDVRVRTLGDDAQVAALSLIDEHGERYVRMAHLACVGSHAINGVAALHTELLKSNVLKDFYGLWPERFSNRTNGVTPRRWLKLANPRLAQLLHETLGDAWVRDLDELAGSRTLRRRCGIPRPLGRHQARQQGRARSARRERRGHAARSRIAIRRASEADPRVQAAALEHTARHRSISPVEERLRNRSAAHLHLRRQSRARVSPCETDDQAHQLRRRSVEPGPCDARPAARALHAELQRQQRLGDLSGRRSVGANIDGRQRGFRHGQYEIRHERRAHDRHARRRERRAARGGRCGQLLPVRHDRARSGRIARRGLQPRRLVQRRPGARGCRRARPQRLFLSRRHGAVRAVVARFARLRPVSSSSPTSPPTAIANGAWPMRLRPRPLDAHVDCERGAYRQILLRPYDPRVLLRHLAYPVRADQTQLRRAPRLG